MAHRRLMDRFPPRLSDPLERVTGYVAGRAGAGDLAAEQRALRAEQAAPVVVQERLRFATMFGVWDPGNLSHGFATFLDVTLSGVTNDGTWTCHASHSALNAFGGIWLISAWPYAANTVRVVLANYSGVAADVPTGTLRVTCQKA
jgi:hypothetical protein